MSCWGPETALRAGELSFEPRWGSGKGCRGPSAIVSLYREETEAQGLGSWEELGQPENPVSVFSCPQEVRPDGPGGEKGPGRSRLNN